MGLIIGAIPTYLFMRQRERAALEKTYAETRKINAEERQILAALEKAAAAPARKVKLLFIASNPMDRPELRLAEEIRGIAQAVRSSRFRESFELQQLWGVHWTDLRTHLLHDCPDILHFSGHGENEKGLVFEDDQGNAEVISPEQITALVSHFSSSVRLVVINTQLPEKLAADLAKAVDHVVGASVPLADAVAIRFSGLFYEALANGNSTRNAFDFAAANLDSVDGSKPYRIFVEKDAPEPHLLPQPARELPSRL
ncbi:MAG TPA: hypothetical protein VFR37_12680 [Longimicrobium sp.]|nr:hypothetical protein [Longimicrobium sp.]